MRILSLRFFLSERKETILPTSRRKTNELELISFASFTSFLPSNAHPLPQRLPPAPLYINFSPTEPFFKKHKSARNRLQPASVFLPRAHRTSSSVLPNALLPPFFRPEVYALVARYQHLPHHSFRFPPLLSALGLSILARTKR